MIKSKRRPDEALSLGSCTQHIDIHFSSDWMYGSFESLYVSSIGGRSPLLIFLLACLPFNFSKGYFPVRIPYITLPMEYMSIFSVSGSYLYSSGDRKFPGLLPTSKVQGSSFFLSQGINLHRLKSLSALHMAPMIGAYEEVRLRLGVARLGRCL